MTDTREYPPPATAPAAPTAAMAVTRPGRVVGLDGIRGLAALFVVLNHIFDRAWPGYPANPAPFWAAWMVYGRGAVVIFIALSGFSLGLGRRAQGGGSSRSRRTRTDGPGVSCRPTGPRSASAW